ncbi:hypothetical protein BDV37DRAFT_177592 [Aspergillus pseudonomiae]|uniref:Uncharacterized protein n=1 Tax=Aspergillus pseudonomiae TaxID=1506151 RepID=A0A5N7D6Z1_9EURO|nr:uncharacterized protein BDV37DRAFT_177592 [Aspergillus pseudonomiae]KAE8401518.1 hypothetical protein BDV37DRAFT_177592 [Aspergillus pseudonomiae]
MSVLSLFHSASCALNAETSPFFCSSLVDFIRVVPPLFFSSFSARTFRLTIAVPFPDVLQWQTLCRSVLLNLASTSLSPFSFLHKLSHHDSSIRIGDGISGIWIWIWEVYVHYVCPHFDAVSAL